MMMYKLEFVNVLQERYVKTWKMSGKREWRLGGEDEEECKAVVKMNMSYEIALCINNEVY